MESLWHSHPSRGSRVHAIIAATATAVIAIPAIYLVAKKVLTKRRAQVQFTSSQFVLSAGAVSFEIVEGKPKKVLLVHHTRKNEWLLAKGRKDQGEDLAAAAVREVLEETGYSTPSATLPTVAFQPDVVRAAEGGTEPFAITIRPTGLSQTKLIFWYIGCVDNAPNGQADVPLVPQGTHMSLEGFGEVGLFSIDEALQKLTYEGDRDLVRTAVSILS